MLLCQNIRTLTHGLDSRLDEHCPLKFVDLRMILLHDLQRPVHDQIQQTLHKQRRIGRPPQRRIPLPEPLHDWSRELDCGLGVEGYNGAVAEEEHAHRLNTNGDAFASFELFERESCDVAAAFAGKKAALGVRESMLDILGSTWVVHVKKFVVAERDPKLIIYWNRGVRSRETGYSGRVGRPAAAAGTGRVRVLDIRILARRIRAEGVAENANEEVLCVIVCLGASMALLMKYVL